MDTMSSPPSSSPRPTTSGSEPLSTNIHPPTLPSNHSPPISEIIGETFPPFDHQANIVTPFNDETNKDLEFERGLSLMLLNRASLDVIHARNYYGIDYLSLSVLRVDIRVAGRNMRI